MYLRQAGKRRLEGMKPGLAVPSLLATPLHPLTLKSDLHLTSPYNINPESNIKSHENKGNNHQLKKPID